MVPINASAQEIFSDNLKELLDIRKLSQTDLVERMGVSPSTVSDWCTAKKFPRVEKIKRIAEILNVEMSDLMSYEGYRKVVKRDQMQLVESDPVMQAIVTDLLAMEKSDLLMLKPLISRIANSIENL